jgi:hypothetical protein
MNYTNNAEYRECIRNYFKMNPTNCSQNIQQDWDEETIDEMSYDDSAISGGLDVIYNKTKIHTLFKTIYQNAAAKMISMDNEIGLAVCISYDYFKYFHACVVLYDRDPTAFNESSQEYKTMIQKLG